MSISSTRPAVTLCLPQQHIVDLGMAIGRRNFHPDCAFGRTCVPSQEHPCPMAMLSSTYKNIGLWDASDPKHRACCFGQPCSVTGEKSCARILYLAKHSHVYDTCSAFSGPDHTYCPPISPIERRWLFPSCSACGVLTEARVLVLIHRRMLDECAVEEEFTDTDIECIKKSLAGYMRAYEVRRELHLQELHELGQAGYELEMRYARGEDASQLPLGSQAGRNRWWKKTVVRVVKAVARVFCV